MVEMSREALQDVRMYRCDASTCLTADSNGAPCLSVLRNKTPTGSAICSEQRISPHCETRSPFADCSRAAIAVAVTDAPGASLRAVLRVRDLPEPNRQEDPQVHLHTVRHQTVRAPGWPREPARKLSDLNYLQLIGVRVSRTSDACRAGHAQVYARSNRGKEVRQVVQRLNAERGSHEDAVNLAARQEAIRTAPDNVQASDAPQHDWSTYIAPKACCNLDSMPAAAVAAGGFGASTGCHPPFEILCVQNGSLCMLGGSARCRCGR